MHVPGGSLSVPLEGTRARFVPTRVRPQCQGPRFTAANGGPSPTSRTRSGPVRLGAQRDRDVRNVIVEVFDDPVPDGTALQHDASTVQEEEERAAHRIDAQADTMVREQVLDGKAFRKDSHDARSGGHGLKRTGGFGAFPTIVAP
jgi:hypothetical protein